MSQLKFHHISGNYSSHHAPEQNTVFSCITSTEADDVMQLQCVRVCVCVGEPEAAAANPPCQPMMSPAANQLSGHCCMCRRTLVCVCVCRSTSCSSVKRCRADVGGADGDIRTKEQMFDWK